LTKVSIAFICDSNYVIPTVVAITSLICNKNPDTYYDIYLIAAELSETEIGTFDEFRGSKIDIHIIRVSLEKIAGIRKSFYITATACFKFDLPNLIPHQDKVLYLDSDILIQKDLSDLFEININDYYAGVIKDIVMMDNDLNIKNYFNSGVMLLNLNLLRNENMPATLLNTRRSSSHFTYMDQDCFNVLFEKKVKLLPMKYNCFYNFFLRFMNKYTIDYINKCFGTEYSSYDDIKKDSYILHLIAWDKPWIYRNSVLAREWEEYFKKSPLKHQKLKRKSIKLRKMQDFIESHNTLNTVYYFFRLWHGKGFEFAMGKAKDYFINKKRDSAVDS
jgi:lipopolysaccharide biosynthesis glycosyltransferase